MECEAVAVCGSRDMWELNCLAVASFGIHAVWKSWCLEVSVCGVAVSESGGVWERRFPGDVVDGS